MPPCPCPVTNGGGAAGAFSFPSLQSGSARSRVCALFCTGPCGGAVSHRGELLNLKPGLGQHPPLLGSVLLPERAFWSLERREVG